MQIDTAGTYTLKYTAEDACGNITEVTREVVAEAPPVYGAVWQGAPTTRWVRTDLSEGFVDPTPAINNGNGSSPFDDIMPWSGMQIVEDADAGTLVSIPKYWYKMSKEGRGLKIQISSRPIEGFFVSPAHANRGDGVGERDVVYVSRYFCSSADYKSTTGVAPMADKNKAAFRQAISNLGASIWQQDYAMYLTIMMLYLVEYADWDGQSIIGVGSNEAQIMGATDGMMYHTGTSGASRSDYAEMQYRHIADFWGNMNVWCDGVYFDDRAMYCIQNPALFDNSSGGTLVGNIVGQDSSISNGIAEFDVSSAQGFEYALIPTLLARRDVSGTKSVYLNETYAALILGRIHEQSGMVNGIMPFGNRISSDSAWFIGSRLMKLPSA